MAGSLAVFDERLECLVDERHVLFVDVETEQTEAASRTSANAVQELECLANQVVVGLAVLRAQVVLKVGVVVLAEQLQEAKDGLHDGQLERHAVVIVALRRRLVLVACQRW